MKKKLQKVFAMVLAISMLMSMMSFTAFAEGEPPASQSQVTYPGGESSDDHVKVSKTIEGTEYENVFDITLTVETETELAEVYRRAQDTAIVIVMDISNTMRESMSSSDSSSRYSAAMTAAKEFIELVAATDAQDGVNRQVGFVAFNTSAHQIATLQPASESLYNTVKAGCDNIINNYGSDDHTRYTNIEAGLAMAKNMLASAKQPNKYVIFMSDGFPTTYSTTVGGTTGYEPYMTENNPARFGEDGYFFDYDVQKPVLYGTSYSDKGANRAQNMAAAMKAAGYVIYSVGVGLGQQHVAGFYNRADGTVITKDSSHNFSVVDCDDVPGYVIGEDTESYKTWLKNSIASGRFYDATTGDNLTGFFGEIFASIKTNVETSAAASWVASDPMNATSASEIDFMEFLEAEGDEVEFKNDAISWHLFESAYTTSTNGNKTTYTYSIKYRVRLANEDGEFKENSAVDTNGETTLNYQVVVKEDGNTVSLVDKEIDFKVPSVKGYLGEFLFRKVDSKTGDPIKDTEFTLTHDSDCTVCNLEGANPGFSPIVAKSDADGIVEFKKIPSGHTYTLKETAANDGYAADNTEYDVVVAFDKTTVDGMAVVTSESDLFKTVGEGDAQQTVAKEAADFVDDTGAPVDTFFEVENTPKAKLTITKVVDGPADPGKTFGTGYFKFDVKNEEGTYSEEIALPLADGSWSITLDKLPNGTYSVTEKGTEDYNKDFLVDGYSWKSVAYTTAINGDTVETLSLTAGDEGSVTATNTYTYTPDNTTIRVVKKWHDDGNRDGIRPDGVIFQLVIGGRVVGTPEKLIIDTSNKSSTMADGGFSYNPRLGTPTVEEIGYIVKNDDGTVTEVLGAIPGYTADTSKAGDAIPTITNKHEPEVVTVNVEKIWDETALGRERNIVVILKADDKEINRHTIELPEVAEGEVIPADAWKYTFTTDKNGQPLYKYADGVAIDYEVEEAAMSNFYPEYDDVVTQDPQTGNWTEDWTIINKFYSAPPPPPPVITPEIPEEDLEEPEVPLGNLPEEDVEIPEEDVPLAELPEEEVPLAMAPATGDASMIWMALSALSGAGLFLTRKKREDEE